MDIWSHMRYDAANAQFASDKLAADKKKPVKTQLPKQKNKTRSCH